MPSHNIMLEIGNATTHLRLINLTHLFTILFILYGALFHHLGLFWGIILPIGCLANGYYLNRRYNVSLSPKAITKIVQLEARPWWLLVDNKGEQYQAKLNSHIILNYRLILLNFKTSGRNINIILFSSMVSFEQWQNLQVHLRFICNINPIRT